MDSLEKPQ